MQTINLPSEVTSLITKLSSLIKPLLLEKIQIDSKAIRAISEDLCIVIYWEHSLEPPFTSINIGNGKLLAAKLNLLKSTSIDSTTIQADVDEFNDFIVKKLSFKNRSTSGAAVNLSVFTGIPAMVEDYIPTTENKDLPIGTISIPKDIQTLISSSKSAMSADKISLYIHNNECSLSVSDVTDNIDFDISFNPIDDTEVYDLKFSYNISALLRFLQNRDVDSSITICQMGSLQTYVNGILINLIST